MARSGATFKRDSSVSPSGPNRYRSGTLLARYCQGLSAVDAHWTMRTKSTGLILLASASVPQLTKWIAWSLLPVSWRRLTLQESSNRFWA